MTYGQLGVALLGVCFSAAASATVLEFNYDSLSVTKGASYTSVGQTVDGITVDVTAFTIDNNGNFIDSQVQLTGAGTGVYVSSNSNSAAGNIGVVSSANDSHDLDGSGLNEGLLFTFDQLVTLDYVNFDRFGSNDDFSLNVDGNQTAIIYSFSENETSAYVSQVAGQIDEYIFDGITGTQFLFWANGSNDDFRIDTLKVTAAAVPEPSVIALMGLGLFGMGLMRRKKSV